MTSERLTELSVTLITEHIRANIKARLDEVNADRGDFKVTTEAPRSYFIFPTAKVYNPPGVFVISTDLDMRWGKGANHINALERMVVAVVVEDRNERLLTIKGWRYQAALAKLLQFANLVSVDSVVKLITRVTRLSFSEVKEGTGADEKTFRQETVVDLEVEHYENF